ncbi:MAG TPA: 4Fe-4S dicluster domain-containing protein, partial [bacterium]|nr:4Fe-4S dicluster domain-containing protein [bacterium]
LNYLPEFKLPKEIIEKEKRRLEKLGVKFEKEKKIEEIPEKYKFVGLMPFYVDYLNYDGKEKAVSLKDFIQKEDFEYKKVLFIGSDIWTINFARLLRRKNIEVIVLTKEKENKTMAPSRDIEMAKEEGVEFFFEAKPVKLEENSGKFIMNLENGEKFEVDIVVDIKDGFGFKGYDVDRNTLKAKETEGVWAVPSGEIDLTRQIWWGAQGAKIIDAFINGKELEIEKKPKKVVSFKKVNYAYFNEAERIEPEFLSVDKRTDIYEDEKNYKLSDAIKEAERCFVCGFCNSCGNCWVFCPDGAILFDKGYPEVNYDYCKGCGICAEECPRGIIEMVPER